MAQASYPPPPLVMNPMAVIGPQFCAPYNVDLTIAKKLMTIAEGSFVVLDVNGNVVFQIKGKMFSVRDRRVLLDAANNPVVSMQQKILSAHRRWEVYRGDSSNSKDLLFSVKKSSLIQFKTRLDVFLACNVKEDICDFKIEGNWFERSCVIYSGITGNIVAQMHRKHSIQSIVLDKDTFSVTVYPHVDYAFITTLIAILNEINEDRADD